MDWRLAFKLKLCFCVAAIVSLEAAGETTVVGGGSLEAQPLRQDARATGRFEALTPEATGLTHANSYSDPGMWGSLFKEFSEGAIGTGVAVGDFNGDGLPDLYIANKAAPNRLYLQLEGLSFADATEEAGVAGPDAWATGVSVVDVNQDGLPDIYACFYAHANQLYINRGDGSFEERGEEYGLDIADASVCGAFMDYDRDGDLDLYLLTNVLDNSLQQLGQRDRLLRNDGEGRFVDVGEESGIWGAFQGHSATWWDWNGDSWPDLYVANDFAGPDQLYRNNGDGTFTDVALSVLPHSPYYSMGSDFGDMDGDGRFDFYVADMKPTTHYKRMAMMGDMGTLIERAASLPTPQLLRNALYLNTDGGRFIDVAPMFGVDATDWTWAVRIADLDNDGWNDLFVTNGMVRSFADADLFNRAMRLPSWEARAALYKRSGILNESNLAFRNLGGLRCEPVQGQWNLDHVGVSFGCTVSDLDRDGDLDLVYTNYDSPPSLYRNDLANGNALLVQLRGTHSNANGIGATIRLVSSVGPQIRMLVPARGTLSGDEPIAHFGLGGDSALEGLEVLWPSGHRQLLTDVKPGFLYTITEPGDPPPPLRPPGERREPTLFTDIAAHIDLNFESEQSPHDDFARQPLLPLALSGLGPGLGIGDLDGDGSDDIAVGSARGQGTAVFLKRLEARSFEKASQAALEETEPLEGMGILWFDMDGDGDDDLFVASGGVEASAPSEYRDRMFSNHGGRLVDVSREVLPNAEASSSSAAACDFDRDGDLDLFVGGRVIPAEYPRSPPSRLLVNEGGRFVDRTSELAPALADIGRVTSALWSDADGDGWTDLLVSAEWGSLRLLRNEKGRLADVSQEAGLAEHHGLWNSISGGDFDGDGDIDYIALNAGRNTGYEASSESPALLFYGDFEGTGRKRIVEAYYEDGRLLPRRGYRRISSAMPYIGRRWPTFHSYAASDLAKLFGGDALQAAERYQVTELRSMKLLNDGGGRFMLEPLPPEVQTAPAFGAVVQDFTGDGNVDVLLAQNTFAPHPDLHRFDGGLSLVLVGNGAGGFVALSAGRSGVAIAGEARAAVATDIDEDGWADVIVSQSEGSLLALYNNGLTANECFGIRLRSGSGNPRGVGARIVIHRQDGRSEAHEIYCGSSYLSQSEPTIFTGSPPSNPIRSIDVRWPDGSVTQHDWNPVFNYMTIVKPSAPPSR